MKRNLPLFAVLFLTLFLGGPVQARVASPDAPETMPPSVVEVPIRISLESLFEVAEKEMPLQSGSWPNWTRRGNGVTARYHAWRGPLSISVQGDELLIQAHVRYWLQARKKFMGMNMQGSCGLNERPRQAVIGVRVRLDLGPDWSVWPQFMVMPTRFLDSCEMTMASIDVTPIIASEFQKQLSTKMYSAFNLMAPEVQKVRSQAEQNWLQLQQPVELWKDHWLMLNPQGVALSPMYGQGKWVDLRLALLMSPEVVNGVEPAPRYTQLPALMQIYPATTGMRLQLSVDMSYESLARTMSEELAAEAFQIQGHKATIRGISLSGRGQEISATLDLGGELAGKAEVKANLDFLPETQRFALRDLDYDATLQDVWLEADARLFHNAVRRLLEQSTNKQLQGQMQAWKERLLTTFAGITPDDMQLDVTSLRFEDIQVSMAEDSVRLHGLATGHVVLLP